jgi:hypothetical protein
LRPFRAKFEILTFWLPIALLAAGFAAVGGHVDRYSQIPVYLSPALFISGAALVCGAIVGLFEPLRCEHWFRRDSEPSMRDASQYLFALIFGTLIMYWSIMAAITPWL